MNIPADLAHFPYARAWRLESAAEAIAQQADTILDETYQACLRAAVFRKRLAEKQSLKEVG